MSAGDPIFDLATTPIGEGTTVIEASAGTGKTYCLVGLALRLLLEGRVESIARLLVVTFTVAATEELVTRIRQGLHQAERVLAGEVDTENVDPLFVHLKERHGPGSADGEQGLKIIRRALVELDDLAVSTIHGFAKRVLDERAFETGLPFEQELLDNDEALVLLAARDFWRHRLYPADPVVAAVVRVRRLTPESFLDDFRTWRRHPATELLPPPLPLERLARQLGETRRALVEQATAANLESLGRQLGETEYLARRELPQEVVERHLEALAGLARRVDAAGLGAVETLAGMALVKRVKKKSWPALAAHPLLAVCDAVNQAVDELVHGLRGAFFHQVAERLADEKQRLAQVGFDDLLRHLDTALDDPGRGATLAQSLGEHYQAALIDEFQDTDLLQYRVFRRLFGQRLLVLIGDPKQAIYRFRGADVFAYMEARAAARQRYGLGQNWRSARGLVEAVNAIFSAGPEPFVFEAIPFVPTRAAGRADRRPLTGDGGRPLEWLWLPDETTRSGAELAIREAVTGAIATLLSGQARIGDRPVEPGDIAILVRTNAQAQSLRQALDGVGIPAILSRAGDVWASPEMAELEAVLTALAEPRDSRRLRAAVATRLWGGDETCLRSLLVDDTAWQDLLDRVTGYRRLWQSQGFMPMMRRWIQDLRVESRLLAELEGERRITNLLHAVELLHQASHRHHLSPTGLVTWLAEEQRRHRTGLGSSEGTELRLESDDRAVQIVTIHKSKGLEYNIVFCPFLWQGRPTPTRPPVEAQRDPRHRVFDFGGEDFEEHRRQAEAERMAEDLRLAYVALTRARHRTVVVWGHFGRKADASASALAHLLHPMIGPEASGGRAEEPADRAERRSREMAAAFGGWAEGLRTLVANHPEAMAFTAPADRAEEGPRTPAPAPPVLTARSFPDMARPRLRTWRLTSFTHLARNLAVGGSAGATTAALASAPRDPRDHADPPTPDTERAPTPGPARGLFAFARGARPGQCLHELLEQCDLTRPESEENGRRSLEILRRFGLDRAAAHRRSDRPLARDFDPATVVRDLLRTVATLPVPGAGFRLGEVAPSRCLVEWQFHLPLDDFAPHRLAELFDPHDSTYAERLAGLGLGASGRELLAGFLTGFVDLALVHDGRWYLLDWKSNHLGDHFEDYRRERLREVMVSHHYLLQYHLYALALHRYLRHRQPGWDYERDFGGVIYVFLRGLRPADSGATEGDEATGWWIDRPPIERIEDLDRLARGGAEPDDGSPRAPSVISGGRR